MSEANETGQEKRSIEFEPILPDTGILFYEECPVDYEIDKPKLLPLKSSTQLRFEQLQQEAARVYKERQKTSKNT